MLYWMDSKTFQDIYLEHEDDDDIIKTNYIIVSSYIFDRDSKYDTILNAKSRLYPDYTVYSKATTDEMREEYFNQLDNSVGALELLSLMVTTSLIDKENMVFICSKNENNKDCPYLKFLAEYIFIKFGYPVYDYKKYVNYKCGLIEYDTNKVLSKIHKVKSKLDNENEKYIISSIKTYSYDIDKLDKKTLKSILKKNDMYVKGMSKSEMIDCVQKFI